MNYIYNVGTFVVYKDDDVYFNCIITKSPKFLVVKIIGYKRWTEYRAMTFDVLIKSGYSNNSMQCKALMLTPARNDHYDCLFS